MAGIWYFYSTDAESLCCRDETAGSVSVEKTDGFRHVIRLRYRLIPYLYSEYIKAALRDEMMFRPLSFDYPEDSYASQVEDQLLLGNELMLAPVCEQNARGRYVYLPEEMKLVRFLQDGTMKTRTCPAGHQYIDVPLTDVVFFLRPDCCIPLAKRLSAHRRSTLRMYAFFPM